VAIRNISVRLLLLAAFTTASHAQHPALYCLEDRGILARDTQGRLTRKTFQETATTLAAEPGWETAKASFEQWIHANPQPAPELPSLLRTFCGEQAETVNPDVTVLIAAPNSGENANAGRAYVHFIYSGGVRTALFIKDKNGVWSKPPNNQVNLTEIFQAEREEDVWPLLSPKSVSSWDSFWDVFLKDRIADQKPMDRVAAGSGRIWIHISTVHNSNDFPSPARLLALPRVVDVIPPTKPTSGRSMVGWILLAASLGFLVRQFLTRDFVHRLSRLQQTGDAQSKAPVLNGRDRPANGPAATQLTKGNPRSASIAHDSGPPTDASTERLDGYVMTLSSQIVEQKSLIEKTGSVLRDVSTHIEPASKKIADASHKLSKDGVAVNDASTRISSVARTLECFIADLKTETASLPQRSRNFDEAAQSMNKAAEQLTRGHESLTELLGRLKADAGEVAVARREAEAARSAEKEARQLSDRLKTETAQLKKQLENDTTASVMPVLAKLEDELKKGIRNFSGSTRDPTGLTAPLLALLISHCLRLIVLGVKNNDPLLQSAMRSNLSRITEIGGNLNLLGFLQARETLEKAGWFIGGLSGQQLSEDSDLKDASWFQTALKCIRDRETLEFGPFYIGLDAKGKVQYVN